MDHGELNKLKIPDPQRIDVGSTEGEDSVTSVRLKLISRAMEAMKSFQSHMHIKPEGHQGSGAINQFMAPQGLNIGLQAFIAPQSKSQDLFFNSREVSLFNVPGPFSMAPGHVGQNGLFGPLDPL
ncbi:hypothetical protein O181_078483 [Austropuccinia psidii MF-1]|uniref:Uncharacterized protein n=1 Tax=Austropuccinia psidii MF-1 TaxID=1389203 RepID=A0A9Q3FJ25_9BASI|nr:hypothetical protein [Austropuccinia psidii MF-1]